MSVSVRISDKSMRLLKEIAKKNKLYGTVTDIATTAIEEYYNEQKKRRFYSS
jgi:predicted transcriptional regulator